MREFELIIDDALKAGLSPEQMTPFNSQFLHECIGFRCGRLGLEAAKLFTNPLPALVDLEYVWPFPQFLVGDAYNILIVRKSLLGIDYVYTVSDDYLTVNLIATLTHATYGIGSLMEFADFGEYAFMTNGVVMVYWNVAGVTWSVITSSAYVPMMKTICNLNGQAVGGNISSAWYDCDETFYVWSKIGSMDFTPSIENESGYRRCPYGGEVYHVRKLGNDVVGYSSKGITLLSPVNDPVPSYRFTELYDLGLINRGAIDGSVTNHVFVDEDYNIVKISKEGIAVLGFQQHMESLGTSEDIIVQHDDIKNDFYIGNSEKTFLLSPNGLTEVTQHPSSVFGISHMIPDTVDSTLPLITSEAFDMTYKGQKTISVIETDAFSIVSPYAAVDYSFNYNTWSSAEFTPINNLGIASINAAGGAFRFKLRFADINDDFRIGYIGVRYKMTDLRGIRGVYAPPIRGQR